MPAGTRVDERRRIDLLDLDLGRADACANGYHDRVRPPSATLATLRPLFPQLGITRVGLLTGLDVIGIPVAFATRPNSFTLSVFQGKGMDADASMVSAAMEAFETRIAELPPSGMLMSSLRHMRSEGLRTIRLDETARCNPCAIGLDEPIPWCFGLDLISGEQVAVPWWLVGLDHREPRPSGFEQSSDGLSSGNSPAEAALHGLCELVERDAWTLMRLWPQEKLLRARVDPTTFQDPVLDTLVGRIERANMDLVLMDITSDIDIPSYMAVIVPRTPWTGSDPRRAEICGGAGCHPVAARAAIRAVVEAAQTRLTAIAGSRDDFTPEIYGERGGGSGDATIRKLGSARMEPGIRLPRKPVPATIQGHVARMLEHLVRSGIEEVVAVPLGDPCLGLSVVRMIVPGLEVDLDGANIQLGARAARTMRSAA